MAVSFKDEVEVDYAASISESEERRVRSRIFDLTPADVTSALQDAAQSLDRSALFAGVAAIFVENSVQITYGRGSVPVPTTDNRRDDGGDGKKSGSKSGGSSAESVNVLVVTIAVAGTVAAALAITAACMAFRRRQNQRYFLARSGELLDPAFDQNSVEMT